MVTMPSGRRSNKRPYGKPHEEFDADRALGGAARVETGPRGEQYYVATPRPTDKTYICPGCNREIAGETQHIVAWPVEHILGEDAAAQARRHWHSGCWRAFGRG
jgi:hypothetical protein